MFPEIDRQAILEIVEDEEKTDKIMALLEEAAKREKQRRLELQAKGIERARQKGTTLGRPRLPLPRDFPNIYRRYKSKEITAQHAQKLCNMSANTFYRVIHEFEEKSK
ncbi:hypothetical protein LJB68_04545 [bacterium 210820-DFI.6.52]|uniref:Resolvase/invertase-type recombinase catalytic domain-containing protein n=1 Tax=Bittarella massiliensis (ex Durand et al. 2017) TaxID=1720313 RepID=A0ABW9WX40_9FIRM|nr:MULTISPECIES: hypothetical protein [Eubacteriales]ERI98148.1 hypothetical protein HMPREF0262_03055 [Clostridium sp. ATCC 29733]MCB5940831.1 hypothetical protein [bacterium 210820-DFI.6.52]MZL69593.1 hypothetical protein [Bittarella massiliensis (ex Durand et al. 2017)]MZL80510.1 hypothetical protein [Bittarella massiliensis (ex Durand et al. 2017)]